MSWRAKLQRFSLENHILWAANRLGEPDEAKSYLLSNWGLLTTNCFRSITSVGKKRLPSWYETQIADEDNCGLSVSPLPPSQHWRGHGSRCGVTFHRGAAAEAKNSNAGLAGSKYAPVPGRDTFCRIQFRQFSNSQLRKAYKRGSGAISWVVKLRRNQLSSDTRLFFASFHWAANKMRFHF